jgi:hypothetical protein
MIAEWLTILVVLMLVTPLGLTILGMIIRAIVLPIVWMCSLVWK